MAYYKGLRKLGPVALNLHNCYFDDVIRKPSIENSDQNRTFLKAMQALKVLIL